VVGLVFSRWLADLTFIHTSLGGFWVSVAGQPGGQGPDRFIPRAAMHLAASVADCPAWQGENDRTFAVDFE
jgi:hypothetical protein